MINFTNLHHQGLLVVLDFLDLPYRLVDQLDLENLPAQWDQVVLKNFNVRLVQKYFIVTYLLKNFSYQLNQWGPQLRQYQGYQEVPQCLYLEVLGVQVDQWHLLLLLITQNRAIIDFFYFKCFC